MAKVRITDKYAAAIKVDAGQDRLEVFDQDVKGLVLRVTAAGRKSWVFRYRALDGTQRRHAIGQYWTEKAAKEVSERKGAVKAGAPQDDTGSKTKFLTIEQARSAARDLVNEVARGYDPSAVRQAKADAIAAQPIKTVADLYDVYMKASESGEWKPRKKKKRPRTIESERWLWEKHVCAKLEALPVEAVKADTIKKLLRDLTAAGIGTTSNRVRSFVGQMFKFAVHEERIEVNPVSKVKPMHEETPRARILTDDELRRVWQALNDPSGLRLPAKGDDDAPKNLKISERVRIALKLLILTLKRRSEVAGMEMSELDLGQSGWTLPANRTKANRAEFVPLSADAVMLIRRALEIQSQEQGEGRGNCQFLFSHRLARDKHITASALSHALRDLRLALGLPRLTPHDLRRTASTIMASERLRVSMFLIGRLLNHSSERDGAAEVTVKTYAVYEYVSEKRSALNAWAKLLADIVGEAKPSNVIELARGGWPNRIGDGSLTIAFEMRKDRTAIR